LAAIPDGEAKADGVKLGAAVANKAFHARASDAPHAYRPNTRPGLYVLKAITAGWSMAKIDGKIAAHTNSDDSLARINGQLLIKQIKADTVPDL
jgi:hypothetical protein